MELYKAFKNKIFYIALSIMTLLVLLHFYYMYKDAVYYMKQQFDYAFDKSKYKYFTSFGSWSVHALYINGGQQVEIFWQDLFFLIIPIISVITYGWTYAYEKKIKYAYNVSVYVGKKKYLISKIISVFITSGLVITLPSLLSFIITSLFFPIINVKLSDCINFCTIVLRGIYSELFYKNTALSTIFMFFVVFVLSGLFGLLGYIVSCFKANIFLAVSIPYCICLIIEYIYDYRVSRFNCDGKIFKLFTDFSPFTITRLASKYEKVTFGVLFTYIGVISLLTWVIGYLIEARKQNL